MASTLTPASKDQVDAYRLQIEGRPILLFDGVCVLCNRTVHFLLRHDRETIFRFVPLESSLGRQLMARFDASQGKEGVVLITAALTGNQRLSRRSDAIRDVLTLLPPPWPVVGKALGWVPRSLRELVYSLVARSRYRLFGRYDTCPIPTREQRSRILGTPF